jgi:hypothetical protein
MRTQAVSEVWRGVDVIIINKFPNQGIGGLMCAGVLPQRLSVVGIVMI